MTNTVQQQRELERIDALIRRYRVLMVAVAAPSRQPKQSGG
jgi:hypothetical protein